MDEIKNDHEILVNNIGQTYTGLQVFYTDVINIINILLHVFEPVI